jgi:PEP-utilising enzyme, mobile domain
MRRRTLLLLPVTAGLLLSGICFAQITADCAAADTCDTPFEAPMLRISEALLAHASLIAREYGFPAVVGWGDATLRLKDGQLVTVDGTARVVQQSYIMAHT